MQSKIKIKHIYIGELDVAVIADAPTVTAEQMLKRGFDVVVEDSLIGDMLAQQR